MRYVVTGGSGLIGSFLIPQLRERGHNVWNYDISGGNDVLRYQDLAHYLVIHAPDVVIHLAAQSGVEQARSQGRKALDLNIVGTVNVLETCREFGINVVVASSNHIYGRQTSFPTMETATLNQRDLYSASKICADVLTQAYAHNYGLNAVAVRSTNTYGEKDPHTDHIVPGTILSLLRGYRPVLRGDGTTQKSYLYGVDCASAYITIAENCEKLAGQAINVTGSEPASSRTVVDILCDIDGNGIDPIVKGKPNDQSDEYLDDSKLRELGWEPAYSLRQGLQATYDWFKENMAE